MFNINNLEIFLQKGRAIRVAIPSHYATDGKKSLHFRLT
jgi:hypothetical protein